ncbi:MAG: hypothetical protein ACYTGZ_21280 [Planctomycetota bacterium]|jgi:hypothetical protein
MKQTIDLQTLEGKLYRSTFEDGLLDVFAGLGLVMIGTGWVLGEAALSTIMAPLLVSFWPGVRQRLIHPRVGTAEFGQKRQAKERNKLLGFAALGVVTFLLGIVVFVVMEKGRKSDVVMVLIPGLPAVLLAFAATLVATVYAMPRYFVYAVVLVTAAGAVAYQAANPGWGMLAGGVASLATGAWLLARFCKRHPVVDASEAHGP